ncbi:MAG: M42 family metallopeptidase [Candidatus Heimdallarchaeota archaeon]
MDTIKLIEDLSNAFGVSGFEDEIRNVLKEKIEPFMDEVRTDVLGNLIATTGTGDLKLMLDAHMDEIGFIIQHIDNAGFLRFAPIGGWDPRILLTHAVTIVTRKGTKVRGVIGAKPPHLLKEEERKKPIPIDEMFIDIGTFSKEEMDELGVQVGDPATIHYPLEKHRDVVIGKALDDRAGCAVLAQVLEEVSNHDLDLTIVANFAIGEEVGLRGARTAAYQINPDIAIALEGTIGADMPGVPAHKRATTLGMGPAITVADRSIIVSPKLVQAIENVAEKEKIPWQYKKPVFGGTDAGAIHLMRGGILTGVISVPCRYIHSPLSLMRLDDFENTVRLVNAFTQQVNKLKLK